jgi:CPA2 family monovalent cation:H+ antiporter-2
MTSWAIILDIVVLLSSCLVIGGLFTRFGQNPLVGYLIAGTMLGGFNLVQSREAIESIAELGVALLLFGLGLEFSWARIKSFGSSALLSGVLQIVITSTVATLAAIYFNLPTIEAIAFGAMVALSSTACVLRVLTDTRELDSIHGRNAISILLVQDMAVLPLAILMTVLSGEGTFQTIATDIVQTLFATLALIGTLYLVLNKLAVLVLGHLTLERNRELTVLLAVATGLGATWASHFAGLSPALGAFIAGMFLGSSPYATQIRADVSSLRVVLLTLFFGSVGMIADPVWIFNNFGLVFLTTSLLIVGKTLTVWTILRFFGQSHSMSIATGLSLAQIGEFAFVLGAIGRGNNVISEHLYSVIISCTIFSLLLTPYLLALAPRIGVFIEHLFKKGKTLTSNSATEDIRHQPDIVIVGFGPAGRKIGEALIGTEKKVSVIDLNRRAIIDAKQLGYEATVGDALQLDVLEHVGLSHAEIIVITIPVRNAALTVLAHAKRLAPGAHHIVRTRYEMDRHYFENAGASIVIGDEAEVGLELSKEVVALLQMQNTMRLKITPN